MSNCKICGEPFKPNCAHICRPQRNILQRENGMHVMFSNKDGEYKEDCMCHLCTLSKDLSPLAICPTLAKLWAISSEHKVIVVVSECKEFRRVE